MASASPPGRPGRLFSVALDSNNGPTPRSHGLHVATDILRMSSRLLRAAAMAVSIALATAVAPARAEVAAAPFDGNLQRLGEILGALPYLRNICGANEGPTWRNEMKPLVDAETPGGDRRARMIATSNRGYRGFPQTSGNGAPSADVVIRRT